MSNSTFNFACPLCYSPLEPLSPNKQRCPRDGQQYHRFNGIWRFLTPDLEAYFHRFIREYETIRRAEGRGALEPTYYRALPFEDCTGRFRHDWGIRAKSFQTFISKVLQPLEAVHNRDLKILDLGAGNGWLSNRLALRGHQLAAIDLTINDFDGLGAHVHYDTSFIPIQADFNRLPLMGNQVDLAIFNASLHYTTRFENTLNEAMRVLHAEGLVVILDTPIYHNQSSGEQMVRERETLFQRQFSTPSDALPSENFFTFERLEDLASGLGVRWQFFSPNFGIRWQIKRWISWLKVRREPARFLVIVSQPMEY